MHIYSGGVNIEGPGNTNDWCIILIAFLSPFLTNGFTHHYQKVESTFISMFARSNFKFLSHVSMQFLYANRIATDVMPHSAASHLGLYCLPQYNVPNRR